MAAIWAASAGADTVLLESTQDGGRKILISGTGLESVHETVRLTNATAEMGYKAALVLTPNFYKSVMLKPESQLVFFRTVADRSKIPLLLYNFPQVTGIALPPDVVAALAEHPNIIGMKDSSGNLEGTKAFIKAAGPDFQVLTGSATSESTGSNRPTDSSRIGAAGSHRVSPVTLALGPLAATISPGPALSSAWRAPECMR